MKAKNIYKKEATIVNRTVTPDTNADKSGTDKSADGTGKTPGPNKFDKPAKEKDPDTTKIDKNADKTKITPTIK